MSVVTVFAMHLVTHLVCRTARRLAGLVTDRFLSVIKTHGESFHLKCGEGKAVVIGLKTLTYSGWWASPVAYLSQLHTCQPRIADKYVCNWTSLDRGHFQSLHGSGTTHGK
jgi:hypothetical protein